MQNSSNKYVVDKCVDILANLYKKEVFRKNGSNQTVDFSGLSELIMFAIEQGDLGQIEPIIRQFVGDKISNYDKVAGEIAERANQRGGTSLLRIHKKIVEDMRGLGQKWVKQCAQAIAQNVKVEKTQAQSFREGLANFKSDGEEVAKQISVDEALQRNAQSLYEKTGKVPEGYSLNKDGQVIRENISKDIPRIEPKESAVEDMEL